MMTREEAIEYAESKKMRLEALVYNDDCKYGNYAMYSGELSFVNAALTALRPVSREQVERMRGEWVAKHRHRGGFRRVTGVDDIGEQRTITIDERREYDDLYCSKCGKQSPDNFLNFCGYCGAPMTDEAVEMVMERLEELKDDSTTD